MISTSCYIGKPILLFKKVTRYKYCTVKTISSMEVMEIIFYCSESLWFVEFLHEFQDKDEMIYLFYFLSSFIYFDCINVSLVVKVFPYFYYFRGYSAIFMSPKLFIDIHCVNWACILAVSCNLLLFP